MINYAPVSVLPHGKGWTYYVSARQGKLRVKQTPGEILGPSRGGNLNNIKEPGGRNFAILLYMSTVYTRLQYKLDTVGIFNKPCCPGDRGGKLRLPVKIPPALPPSTPCFGKILTGALTYN